MNKAQLIDALAERLGDRKTAAAAVAGLVDLVVQTVNRGERVTITGFGVFEKRARAARTARNPRTGQAVMVQQTVVPAFRPGILFREVVSGIRTLPGSADHTTSSPLDGANSHSAARMTAVRVPPALAEKAPKTEKAVKTAKDGKPAKAAEAGVIKSKVKGGTKGSAKVVAKKAAKKADGKK